MANESQGTAIIGSVTDWLMECALRGEDLAKVIEGCGMRLRALGYPILRAHFSFRTIHPLFQAEALTWKQEGGAYRESYPHRPREQLTPDATNNPIFFLIDNNLTEIRRRLVGETAMLDFPLMTQLRDEGGTDYFAFAVAFDDSWDIGIIGSWTADRRSGFTDGEIADFRHLQRYLAVACKMRIEREISNNIATTYLGQSAGEQVLEGHITRGDTRPVRGAIWYSDLRNSTELSQSLSPDEYLALINGYFEITAGSVMDNGGEVLLLIGDAVLGIFPVSDMVDQAVACQRAVAAARSASGRLSALAGNGTQNLSYGVGLHLGEFLLGNIGVPERLEFTAIGPDINEVARLEGLTKDVDHTVVVSGEFAANVDIDWKDLGSRSLKGFQAEIETFALPT